MDKRKHWLILAVAAGLLVGQALMQSAPAQSSSAVQSGLPARDSTVEQAPAQAEEIYFPIVSRPFSFANPYPADGAQAVSPNSWLQWEFTERINVTLPVTFEVYVDPIEETGTEPAVTSLAATAWDPFTFALDTTYAWHVVATDATGQRFTGPTWRFRTEAEASAPDLAAMVAVPEGDFWMGCDAAIPRAHGCFDKEFPLRRVWLDAYEIDKYEVTNQEYAACVAAGRCNPPVRFNSNKRAEYFTNPDYAEYPVLYVSHWDAEAFCNWDEKRLPTEAEWEKAARGPIDTREWPWGAEFPDCTRSNFTDDRDPEAAVQCVEDTDRVGSRPDGASPYGAMDMAGNAFEWVHDLYNVFYYEYAPNVNPPGPDYAHTDRGRDPDRLPYFTIRGGSYRAHWFYTRATHRHWGHKGPQGTSRDDVPYFRNNFTGFRCARSLP